MQRANRVKELRAKRGWTQATLGAKIGVAKETISKIERGGVQRITESQAHALAEVFGVRLDDLYEAESATGAGLEEAMPFVPDASSFEFSIPLEENQCWYQIKKSRLDEIGYRDGDQLIVSLSREDINAIGNGSVVIADWFPAEGEKRVRIARQFIRPSLLITNSHRNNLLSLNANADEFTIVGVVKRLCRSG